MAKHRVQYRVGMPDFLQTKFHLIMILRRHWKLEGSSTAVKFQVCLIDSARDCRCPNLLQLTFQP